MPAKLKKDGGITSTGHLDAPHMWPEMLVLRKWFDQRAEEILKLWDLNFNSFGVTKSWVNSHYNGAWTDSHDHGNAHLVCSVYFKATIVWRQFGI